MKNVRFMFLAALLAFKPGPAGAQQVPLTTVVEHFTNTFCSVCATRNPGFYNNLAAFPEVLHISYYPSAPYAACPFNQMNKGEQDMRTRSYNIYGSTPRLVINGVPLSANANYTDPELFRSVQNRMSDYSIRVTVSRTGGTAGEARISIRKVAAHSADSLLLYAVISEDSVRFDAANGEDLHFDKFNESMSGEQPLRIEAPRSVGDSVIRTFTFTISQGWGPSRVTVLLQDRSLALLQAARSGYLPSETSVLPLAGCNVPLNVFPVPAGRELFISGLLPGYHPYAITNSAGQVVQRGVASDASVPVAIGGLVSGFYVIALEAGGSIRRGTFVKQ